MRYRAAPVACVLALTGCPGEPSSSAPTPAVTPAVTSTPASAAAARPGAAVARPRGHLEELGEHVLAASEAYATVQSLTDRAGARLAGSAGDKLAVEWALDHLTRSGFSAVHAEPVTVPRWERGAESGEVVAPSPHRLAIAALGGSVATPPGGLEAEVVEVPSLEALAALAPGAVKGKIVFFNKPTERTRDGSGYGRAVDVRARGAASAGKLGAAGVVIRSIGTDSERAPHTGVMHYDDKGPKIPAAAISIPDAELVHRLLAAGPVTIRFSLGARTLPDGTSANVVADVPGSGAPEEIVLLGAHLDSWDLGTGAIDDGAGCAIVIEAARAIAKWPKRPRRTVRVVLFANEENGLAGAKAYARAHEAELPRHIVALEADFGSGAPYELRFLGAETGRPAFADIARDLAPLAVAPSAEDARGGADVSPLREAGVPIIDVRQDGTTYFDVHHTANDTMAKVDKAGLDRAAAAFAMVAFAAADMPGDFGRVPDAKRR